MAARPAVLRFPRGLPTTQQFGERLRLLVVDGGDKGTCYSLLGDSIIVGREGCQISLNDTNISRRHAEIAWSGDRYKVRDLGSANGVLRNGEKVQEAELSPGDLVLVGLTVFEVYPPGQARRNERPMLPAPMRRGAAKVKPQEQGAAQLSASELMAEKRKNERKRLMIVLLIFFLLSLAYFNDQKESMPQHSQIPPDEENVQRAGERVKDTETGKKITKVKSQIEKTRLELAEMEKARARLMETARVNKSLLETDAAIENTPSTHAEKQQRADAQGFFRSGVREMQNKNFRRAFTAFDTALTVDPTHELAKIYLQSAKMEMLAELRSMQVAGLRAKDSLRYQEAKMHFKNILRYLEGETGSSNSLDQESNKDLRELFEESTKELQDIEERENKAK
jgi:pSer/pThr/pTyr-binding forkhead associated (FHA) protein